jgi:hypothetical protein
MGFTFVNGFNVPGTYGTIQHESRHRFNVYNPQIMLHLDEALGIQSLGTHQQGCGVLAAAVFRSDVVANLWPQYAAIQANATAGGKAGLLCNVDHAILEATYEATHNGIELQAGLTSETPTGAQLNHGITHRLNLALFTEHLAAKMALIRVSVPTGEVPITEINTAFRYRFPNDILLGAELGYQRGQIQYDRTHRIDVSVTFGVAIGNPAPANHTQSPETESTTHPSQIQEVGSVQH